jgi:hypothetical protein
MAKACVRAAQRPDRPGPALTGDHDPGDVQAVHRQGGENFGGDVAVFVRPW